MILNGNISHPATFEVLEDWVYNSTLKQVTLTCKVSFLDFVYERAYTLTQEQTEQWGIDDSIIIDALCANNGFVPHVEPVVVEEPPVEETTTEEESEEEEETETEEEPLPPETPVE